MSAASILAKLPDQIISMMRNWARSNAGGGMYARSKAFDDVHVASGFDETIVPVLRGEAEDVDNALAALPVRARQAVMLFWQYDNPPLAWLGRRMSPPPCKPLDYRTVTTRIEDGHARLIAELRKQRASARTRNEQHAQLARAAH